jgi:hypothetical protein
LTRWPLHLRGLALMSSRQAEGWGRERGRHRPPKTPRRRGKRACPLLVPGGDSLRRQTSALKPGNSGLFRELFGDTAKAETGWRCCQSNANWSPKCPDPGLSGRQLTRLGQSDRAVLLEDAAAVEVAVLVKVVVDRGVNGGELLKGLDVPEFGHRTLPSSERLV